MPRSLAAWALAALLAAGAAPAKDNLVFSHLTVDQGLSQEFITAVVQDPYGFIWVGTQEGLNRFDGRRFEVFLNEPGNPQSLPHDWVTDLLVAADGRLWVGTRGGGLSVFDYSRSRFEPFGGLEQGFGQLAIRCLHQDQNRIIWAGTDNDGIVQIDRDGTVARLRHDPLDATSLSDDRVRDVVSDPQGRVWVATEGGGLNLWDDQTGKFEAFRHSPQVADTLSSDRLLSLFAAPDGTIWVGTYDAGLSVVNPFRRSVVRLGHSPEDFFSLSSNRVRVVYQDVDGRIWVGTDNGLDLWDPDRRGFHRYRSESGARGSLSDNRITTLMQDRGGVLWVGTYAGLNNWNARVGSIQHYRREAEAPSSLSSDVITSFAEDRNGRLWVGTWGGGLNRIDLASGQIVHYRAGEGSLADDRVMSLLADRGGRLWVGTLSSGLHRFDADREAFTRYRHDPEDPTSISANAITNIFEDSRGWIWVATFGGGLNRLQPDGVFTRYMAGPADEGRLSSNRVIDIAENDDGKLWLATDGGGINIFDPIQERFERVLPDPERPDSLASAAVVSVLITKTDIWLGTRDSGLDRLAQADYRAGRLKFRHYTRQTGLPSNAIQGVLEDDTGMIWLSSNKGITAIAPENDRIRNFREPHGLQGAEFNSGAHYKAQDGTLYFGGNNGFNRFNPRNLFWSSNAYKPPVVLTGLTIFGEAVTFDRPLAEVRSIALNYSDYVVGFEFAALDYTNPEANRYRYRLEGLEDNWNDSGNISRATYTNLAPGRNYMFRVQAANSDGVWSDQELAIAITVRSPPWMTWWAYLVYALLALGVALVVSGLLIRRTRAQTEKRANERLRMYLHCLDEAADAVAILEPDGEIAYHNRALAEMLEHQAGGALRPSQLFASEDSARQALAEVAEHGRWQKTMPRPGDRVDAYLDLTLTQVGMDGTGSAIIAIARDATERKQTEDELKRYRDRLEMLVHKRTQELEQEIGEHKRTENQLRISLDEKELLLKEVHHRVKNNMQVVSSLLHIQTETIEDPAVIAMLNESQNRIRSMALIHESLYQSDNLLQIDFDDYLRLLTGKLNRIYETPGVSVAIEIESRDVQLDIERAVPCGLIVNELVSNSLKHAFKGRDGSGRIAVRAGRQESHFVLEVCDDGVGFPEGVDFREMASMGMEIVCILAGQLKGTIELERQHGTCFVIRFPVGDEDHSEAA